MRDRPAAAANRVTKQSRNRPRRTNAKIKSVASTSAKRPRNDKNEMDIAMSPDGSIASGIDDEARPLAQSDSSKQSRPRHKVSRDRNNPNNSSVQDDRTSAPNSGESNNKRGSKYQDSGDDDGDTQRELAEARQKYSILEKRFHDLHEIAAKKAEENFELLKAKASENTRVADELIAELKEEIAQYTKQVQEMEQLQANVSANKDTIEALQTELAETDQALAKAKSENKALYSKLAASRHIESNGKGSAAGSRTAPGENNAVAQIKEELYADLTGLIVRDVRRVDKEDVFDCIQTGRNGTLHFKLALEDLEAAESYEDVQFAYRPQLDESRDGDLIDVLPDYLTEEITFPRHQASKFYARVIKSLMERVD